MTKKLKCSLQHQVSGLKIRRVNQISNELVSLRMLHLKQQLDSLQSPLEEGVGEEWIEGQERLQVGKLHCCARCFVVPDRDRRRRSFQVKQRMNKLRSGAYLSYVSAPE